ncbi:AraC family transcriptional regulator [Micromonospora endophytica]|uniref:AraC family transcriptional regulator n=1 Tax=Micromonospora endophytica TaxID=515350 RepID=A0A2W2CJL9_9ACTN|nr:AraC family transcriptional regulator [Micromonospora endophytica]PZF99661.1 AraC family transcriptional regulator [Micromonospora endophytica]RIW45377.1 AraC family transcriptional regulator [Micromonospora endophytica]BCJ58497.1 AraC family transcriptional regulator [Micromonospora endophytica]
MDVLSDVITFMRAGQPRSARIVWHAPWAQRFAPVPGSAGFQIVLQGPCWLIAPDTGPVPLAAGDIVFRPHGRGHTLADHPSTPATAPACDPNDPRLPRYAADIVGASVDTDSPVTVTLCGAYQLDPAHAHPLLNDLPEVIHLPAHLGRHPELRATVHLLATELERPRLGTDAIIPALLDTLLLHILRTCLDRNPERGTVSTGWAAALNDPATAAALQAIHRDPARPWTVATLAAEAGLSRAPFARRFSTLLGQPPLTYLTWWRMTTAARLLRQSDTPLSAIARRVGYASEFAFASAFKRQYGTAPGRYRRGS